jgi:hypothetical protein
VEGLLFVNSAVSAKLTPPLPSSPKLPKVCLGMWPSHRTVPYIQAFWASLHNIDVLLYQMLPLPAFQSSVALEVSPPLLAQHIGANSSNKNKNERDFAFMGLNEAFVMV